MFNDGLLWVAGLALGVSVVMTGPTRADALKDEIAPTGKLRVAIAISPAGGAFWSTKNEAGGYAGVPVDLGKEMAAQLGIPVEYVAHQNSGQIVDAVSKGTWDVSFMPKDPEREAKMSFGPAYEVADATYIVKPGSSVTNFQMLDQPGDLQQHRGMANPGGGRGIACAPRMRDVRVPRRKRSAWWRWCAHHPAASRCPATSSTPWRRRSRARGCWMKRSSRP